LNNGIDPLEVMNKHGTDALRMALIAGVGPGNDSIFDMQKVKAYQHFANKLWNITRFILTNVSDEKAFTNEAMPTGTTEADTQILSQLDAVTQEATKALEELHFHEAASIIYQFTWHELADKYIETSKGQLADDSQASNTQTILAYCLLTTLRILHPFMPF